MNKRVLIIGAGIAGLSAGAYLQMNGYETEIFEMNSLPGGLCTSCSRKEYIFNGSIHWLVGTNPKSSMHRLWEELHALGDEIVYFEEFSRIERKNGDFFHVYSNADLLEEEMLRIAPEDKIQIKEFTEAIKAFSKFDLPVDKAPELYTMSEGIKFLREYREFLKLMGKWKKLTIRDYGKRFKNEEMRVLFEEILPINPRFSMAGLIMTLAWMHAGIAGYPVGGSLEFAKRIEKRYLSLGGKVHYNSKVEKIIVENNTAQGIELENGEREEGDIIISAADGHYTLFKMLEGKYVSGKIRKMYEKWPLFPSLIQISLGIGKELRGQFHSVNLALNEPISVDPKNSAQRLYVEIYNYDPTLAPSGKTPVMMTLQGDYQYWSSLRKRDMRKYIREKRKIAERVIQAIDEKLGEISSSVEVVDVATPSTYVRYTNNYCGSFEGWLLTPKVFGKRVKKTLPGLKNFYMVGQWVEPGGGVPTVALSGRNVSQIICKKDGKKFDTSV